MALVNCPECGTQVSDRAEKCPKCAYPLNILSKQIETNREIIVKPKEGCFLQTLNFGCLVIIIICGIIILAIISR